MKTEGAGHERKPHQIRKWKKALGEGATSSFDRDHGKDRQDSHALISLLRPKIGKLRRKGNF